MNNLKTTANTQISFSKAELAFIKNQFFPVNANPKDIEFCLKVAEAQGLNPIKREIFFIERKAQVNGQWVSKIEPLTSRDGFLTIAHKSGNFAGIESFVEVKNTPKLENGQWIESTDLVAVAKVWRKDSDKPTIVEVEYSEYVQLTKNGTPTKFWAKMPKTMLKKVAESQALRKAFNISGIYGVEEMGVGNVQNETLHIDEEAIDAEVENDTNSTSQNQVTLEEMKNTFSQFGISLIENNGWVKADGKVYEHRNLLKQFGFKYIASKKIWVKQVA